MLELPVAGSSSVCVCFVGRPWKLFETISPDQIIKVSWDLCAKRGRHSATCKLIPSAFPTTAADVADAPAAVAAAAATWHIQFADHRPLALQSRGRSRISQREFLSEVSHVFKMCQYHPIIPMRPSRDELFLTATYGLILAFTTNTPGF